MKVLTISITTDCCFKCEGCISNSTFCPDSNRKMNTLSVRSLNLEMLYSCIKKHFEGWHIVITGGEPLIVNGISFFLNKLAETHEVCVMTNNFWLGDFVDILDKKIKILATWHPDMVKFDKFYNKWEKQPGNIKYKYLIHPKAIANGDVERHLELFSEYPLIGLFEGMWNGEGYDWFHPIYSRWRPEIPMPEPIPMLTIDTSGNIGQCWQRKASISDTVVRPDEMAFNACGYGWKPSLCRCQSVITALQVFGTNADSA